MKVCYECGSTDEVKQFLDKYLCEKCLIFFDYDEELHAYPELREFEEEDHAGNDINSQTGIHDRRRRNRKLRK